MERSHYDTIARDLADELPSPYPPVIIKRSDGLIGSVPSAITASTSLLDDLGLGSLAQEYFCVLQE
jgi:hypothetical protein